MILMFFFLFLSGEVKDADGKIRYMIDGHWDRSLECRPVDGGRIKNTSLLL